MVHLSRLFVDIYVLLIFLQMHWGHMSKLNITYFLPLIFKFSLSITLSGVYVIFQLVSFKFGLQAINYTSMSLDNKLRHSTLPVMQSWTLQDYTSTMGNA